MKPRNAVLLGAGLAIILVLLLGFAFRRVLAAEVYNYAIVKLKQGDSKSATRYAEYASVLNPRHPYVWGRLCDLYLWHVNKPQAAEAACRKQVEVNPDGDAYHSLGNVLGKKDIAGAVAAYEQSIKLEPDECIYYGSLSMAFQEQGKSVAAVEVLERGRKQFLRQGCWLQCAQMADLLMPLGRFDEASDLLDCAFKNPAKFALRQQFIEVGFLDELRGKNAEAQAAYREAFAGVLSVTGKTYSCMPKDGRNFDIRNCRIRK